MDTEDFVQSEQSANTAGTLNSNNDHQQIVSFTVQGQNQLNEISQQETTTAAESITGVAPVEDNQNNHNSENVTTYYFRDSEQSEWSSSSSEDEGKHDQSVPIREIEEEEGEQGEVAEKKNKKKKNNRAFAEDFMEDDEGIMVDPKGENMKTKNEIVKVPVYEKEETGEERLIRYGVQFKGTERMVEIGTVLSIVDDKLIVATHNEAREEDKRLIVDLDNMIFDETKQLIGLVDDVFGNIKSPFYAVTMDVFLKELVKSKTISIGNRMYMIEGFNKILMKAQLEFMMKQKGCDASNRFDEEVLMDNEREFSDDELESRSKQKKQNNERKQDLTEIEDQGVDNLHEAVIPPNGDNQGGSSAKKPKNNKNKKIMVMKNENGVLKRLFLKPSEFETLKNNPNNRIQQLPSQNSFKNPEQQQQQYQNPRFNNNNSRQNNNSNQRFNNNFSQNSNQRNHNFHQNNSNNGNNFQQQNHYGQPYQQQQQQQQPMQMQQQQQQFSYQQNQQQIYPNTQQQQYQQQQQQQNSFFAQRQNPSYAPLNYQQQSIPQQAFKQENQSNIPNQSGNYPRNQDGQ